MGFFELVFHLDPTKWFEGGGINFISKKNAILVVRPKYIH